MEMNSVIYAGILCQETTVMKVNGIVWQTVINLMMTENVNGVIIANIQMLIYQLVAQVVAVLWEKTFNNFLKRDKFYTYLALFFFL
jgi:hypothetical protein